jgi:hypothetical protein
MRVAFDLGRFRPRLELPVLQSFCVPTPRRGSCAPASGRERGRPNRCAPISSPQAIRCRAFADGQSGRRQLPRPCRSRSLRPKPLSQSLDNRGVEKVERRDSSAIRLDVPNAFRPVAHIRRTPLLRSRPERRRSRACLEAELPARRERDPEISNMQGARQTPIGLRLDVAAESASCPRKKMCSAGRSPQGWSADRTTPRDIGARGFRASSWAAPVAQTVVCATIRPVTTYQWLALCLILLPNTSYWQQ